MFCLVPDRVEQYAIQINMTIKQHCEAKTANPDQKPIVPQFGLYQDH